MRKIVIIILLLCPLLSYAQKVPDNDDVLNKTIDSNSPFYYPSLMMRYNAGDETLTLEDYHYLYYGYAFTDSYAPLKNIYAEDELLMVLEACGDSPDYNDMLKIITHATEVMKQDPFSPKNLNFMTYAYGAMGDTINERISYNRMIKVIETIENSGTGLSEKSPKHIIRLTHANDLLASRGLEIDNRKVVSRSAEFIYLKKKDGGNLGYYFDFSRIYMGNNDEAPKKKRRWKINDWPVDR